MSGLEGRTAVVTGAGQGVGRGIAHALAAAGAAVVVAARRTETGEPVAAEIRSRGGTAVCIQSDVTVRADVQRAVDAAVATYGGLDVMVHNAFRGGRPHRLEDADDAMWSSYSRTAVWAAYYCAQTAYPRLRDSGSGRFVLVVSPAAIEGSATLPLYSSVKAAQRGLAKSLAREWGPGGITVNCIAPVAATPPLMAAFQEIPELRRRLEARTALGRIGDPETDVGAVVRFLAGDDASYVTGQTIVCDGGGFIGL